MAEQLKYSDPNEICFITTRTAQSRLWFANNPRFCEEILGYLAKYQELFKVEIFHFIIMGNHYHLIARFPKGNRHLFMKLFNRIFSNAAKRHVKSFEGGSIWARRYRPQALVTNEDTKHWFFYSALNPVLSGLVKKISDYPSYNGFHDAISGKPRDYSVVNWEDYINRSRANRSLTPDDCRKSYSLTYSRLPGYEDISESEYRRMMLVEFEERRQRAVEERLKQGKKFAGPFAVRRVKPGSKPQRSKVSDRRTPRPLVLTLCAAIRKRYLDYYFSILRAYSEASTKFRSGQLLVCFPIGTFLPSTLSTYHS